MITETKVWHDEIGLESKFEGLYFEGNRICKECAIAVTGYYSQMFNGRPSQSFHIECNSETCGDIEVGGNNTQTIYPPIRNPYAPIYITGSMKLANFATKGSGKVVVTCSYEKNEYNTKSVSWGDETGFKSNIESLCLDDDRYWEHCTILIENKDNMHTGCMITLLENGDLHPICTGKWCVITNNNPIMYTIPIKRKSSLAIAGYISNHNMLFSGGAKITLTGYYK